MITRQFGIPVTSPGAILRREKDLGTPLGEKTAEVIQHGGLVSDEIIVELIEDWLRLHGGHGFVFDGFPRTLPQAESLMSILTRLRIALDLAIWLEVSEQTVHDRISGRLQCAECGFTTSGMVSTAVGYAGHDPVVLLSVGAISAFDSGAHAEVRLTGDRLAVTVGGYLLTCQRDGRQADFPPARPT